VSKGRKAVSDGACYAASVALVSVKRKEENSYLKSVDFTIKSSDNSDKR
jgi:hypothetical protein